MDTSTEGYLAFVVLGTSLVVGVGVLLTRGGKAYLEDVFRDRKSAGSVSVLLTVLFHLFALGILGVISSVPVPVEGTVQTVVTKLGVVLLILGIVFGSTMLVLNRIRARRELSETHEALFGAGVATPPAGIPVVDHASAHASPAHTSAAPPAGTPMPPPPVRSTVPPDGVPSATTAPADDRTELFTHAGERAADTRTTVPPQRMSTEAQAAAEGHARRGHVIR